MIIKNLANGTEVNVSNTSVCKDGFITAKIHGKEPSPRYYNNYPMLQKLGYAEDGRVMIGLADGWAVVGNRQPNGEAKPASDSKPQTGGAGAAGAAGAAGSDEATATGNDSKPASDEAKAAKKSRKAAAKDGQSKPASDSDSGSEATEPTTNEKAPQAPQMPPFGAGSADPYSAWLQALSQQITGNVMKEVEPLVDKASEAAAKASNGGTATRHEYTWPDRPTTKVDGVTCEGFDKLVAYLKAGYPVYMWGAAGCGKSHTAEQLAEALGLQLYCQSQILFAHDVKGYGDAAGRYVDTPLYKAFTEGGLFFIDEMDASAPEALVVLNQAIANRRYNFPVVGDVVAHEDFRIIAAGNTPLTGADSQYTGRSVQDASSRNRFLFHEMKYDRRVELPAIAHGNEEVVNFVEDLRQSIKSAGLDLVVSYRQTAALADPFLLANVSKPELLRDAVLGGVEADELRIIHSGLIDSGCDWAKALQSLFA